MGASLDAQTMRDAMARFLDSLERHREEIDSLNVFPVPDGDTGTNLMLTQRAVVEACREHAVADLHELGRAVSRAALMGARGNSGVILSQILRGLCDRLAAIPDEDAEPRDLDGVDLAAALSWASEEARKSVGNPLEGTMLSVARDAAEAAGARAAEGGELPEVAGAALEAAKASLERTREQLPELRQAGVVDAGGKGIVLLLDGILSALRGTGSSVEVGPMGPVGHRDGAPRLTEERYGFEVMYLLEGHETDVPRLKGRLGELGDSVVVVGGGGMWNVHVHTDEAGAAVEAGIVAGRPRSIRITSLDEQVAEACVATDGFREVAAGEEPWRPPEAPTGQEGDQSIVAVAEGDGLERILVSLGVRVVRGGPGRLPSVSELVDAIDAAPGTVVHLLPNHPNAVPGAEVAAREASKQVLVQHTRSVPQGIAAALAFNPERDVDDNETSMRVAWEEASSGALAVAEKQAGSRAGPVSPGAWIGIDGGDGEIWAVGPDPATVAATLVKERLAADHHELVTLYVGADATEEGSERVAAALREALPSFEVEVQRGGQLRYPYLIGVE